MQESVELPEAVTLVGLRVQDVLLVTRLTMPANPLSGAMVIVEVAGEPAFTVTDTGLAAIVKSCTTKVTSTE